MAKNPMNRKEFNILRDYVNTTDLKELARETGRSVETLRKVKRAGTWPKFQQINKAIQAKQAEKATGLLDTNLTKKQAQAYLDMQTDLNLANQDRRAKQEKIDRLERELTEYRNRETADILKKARASRSILRFVPFRRTN